MEEQLQEIGKAIQEGRFDPNRLSSSDKNALDGLLKQGLVPGYNSLSDIVKERDVAKTVKAGEYVEAAKPLETATGVSMGMFEGIVAATTALGNYWLRGKDLTKADIQEAYRSKSQNKMARYFKALGTMFDDVDFGKIPKSKSGLIKSVFKGLTDIIPNTRQYFKTSQKLYNMGDPTIIRSKVEADTIAKTALASGFAAGGYSLANSAMDFAANNELDVAKVSNNDLLKLNTPEKMLYSSYEAIKNSLLFDGGALGLFGIIGNALSFGTKFLTGTRGTASRDAVIKSRELGAPVGLIVAADPNATMGPLVKGYGEYVGALPLQSVALRNQKLEFNTAVTKAYMKPFVDQSAFGYLGPIQHTETFGYQALPVMKDLYKQSENQIDDLWESLEGYYRGIDNDGTLDIIGMKQTENLVRAIRSRFDQDFPDFMKERGKQDPNVANLMNQYSPFYSLVKLLDDMNESGVKQFTMGQYINLRKAVNAALRDAKPNDKFIPVAEQLRFAMEVDLNNIAGKGSSDSIVNMFKNSEVVKNNLQKIADGDTVKVGKQTFKADVNNEQTVEVMKTAYLEALRNSVKGMSEKLKTSNYMTTRLLSPFDRLSIKNQLKKYDSFVFSQKSLANVVGGASATPDTLFNNLFRNTFVKGSSGSVNELKKILGVDRVVEKGAINPGKEVYRRAKARFIMDSYFRAFDNPPSTDFKNVIDFVEEAIEKGYVPENYTDELLRAAKNGEPIGYDFFTTKAAKGLGEIDLKNINIAPEELGDFNYGKFLKNLGLDQGEIGYTRLVNVMSDGTSKAAIAKGKKELDTLLDLMYISKEGDAFKVGETAKLLARSVALGGSGRVLSLAYGVPQVGTAVGLGMLGGLPAALLTPLIFRTLGILLTRPKYAAQLLDAYTTEERLAKAGKFKLLPDKIRAKRKLIAQIINAADEENKDKAQIDVDKISDEEITDTIQKMKGYFPNTTVNLEMLPKEMQEKMFPEYVIYKNAKGRDKEFYDQFLAGLQAGTTEISNDDVDGEITPTELLSLVDVEKEKEEEQQLQPPTPQPAFAVNQAPTLDTSLTGVEFGTLFPDDPMGQMIAERRQKRNEQSG